MIELEGIEKTYGNGSVTTPVLREISFRVEPGADRGKLRQPHRQVEFVADPARYLTHDDSEPAAEEDDDEDQPPARRAADRVVDKRKAVGYVELVGDLAYVADPVDGLRILDISDPADPTVCRDADLDECDDCTNGLVDVANDGSDIDGDGESDTLVPMAIIWMQGESDASASVEVAMRYEENLERLMDLIRAALRADDHRTQIETDGVGCRRAERHDVAGVGEFSAR